MTGVPGAADVSTATADRDSARQDSSRAELGDCKDGASWVDNATFEDLKHANIDIVYHLRLIQV
jgi:hypothetical protein